MKLLIITLIMTITTIDANPQFKIKISNNFKIQKYTDISDGLSCQSILQKNPSATTGEYKLTLPNGNKITTLCLMDHPVLGGGWTLITQRQKNNGNYETVNNLYNELNNNINNYVISDDNYQSLLTISNKLLASSVNYNSYYAVNTIENLQSANCTPLSNTLQQSKLVHQEDKGCDGTGSDYALIGASSSTRTTALFNFTSTPFWTSVDLGSNNYVEENQIHIFLK